MAARGRVQGLDVLRGIAVAMVMLCHTWPQTFDGAGIAGVVLFFVLSGYLITGLLQRDIGTHGTVRWQRFYAHRLFRLFPALALMLVTVGAVALATGAQTTRVVGQSLVIGFFYLGDLPRPYFEPMESLNHLWTLAVEEQFYLVWPLVLLVAIRVRRLGAVLVACCAVAMLAAVALPLGTDLTTWQIYRSPTSWAIALLLGAGARIYADRLTPLVRPWMVVAAAVVRAGTAVVPHLPGRPDLFLTLGPLVAAGSAVLVLAAKGRVEVGPAERPLVALGGVSYAAYLWNAPLTEWVRPEGYENLSMAVGVGLWAATIGCAAVSWFTVEHLGRLARAKYDARLSSRAAIDLPEAPALPMPTARVRTTQM